MWRLGIGMELGLGGECVFVCSMGRSGSVEWVDGLVVRLIEDGWVRWSGLLARTTPGRAL